MQKKRYRHIFFDLDNTLWDFEQNARTAMVQVFEHFGLHNQQPGFESFFKCYTRHNDKLWDDYRNSKVTKKELTRRRFADSFEESGISGVDPDDFNSCYLDRMPEQVKLVDGAKDLLQYLYGKRYSMFIITNGFSEVQHKKLVNSGINIFFSKVYTSEALKVPKPAPGIFEYAIKSANARKTGCLMVGDDPDVDISGALQFGIDAVLYDPSDNSLADRPNGFKNRFYKISHLSELKEML